jgi:chemotaxis methyl-accepting protein methylase
MSRVFRDPAVFQTPQEKVLPAIVKQRRPGELNPVLLGARMLDGRKVYSLCDLSLKSWRVGRRTTPIQIYATDISERPQARAGVYPKSISR